MQNIGRLLESQEKVLIDTYRCLMQNMKDDQRFYNILGLNRYISLLNAEL